ncbi:hypothetical protein ABZZ16_40930, partial [Streptomyces sp. NPDC006386]|uniref:hypothetical protein n=1 Tax=Streptomyces sp. NPDC006386 TaxID=3156762 RepID=UPI0033BF82F1
RGRPADAAARARAVLAAYEGQGDEGTGGERTGNSEAAPARRAEAEQLLRLLADQPDAGAGPTPRR